MMLKRMLRWLGQGCAAAAVMAAASGGDPLLTNTTSFRIPFAVDGANDSVVGNAVLFAGFNGGPLELVKTVPASQGGFEFQAATDGRYAFAVRMTDASGAVVSEGETIAPELEVVVDRLAPELNIQLTEIGNGRLNVSWTSSEQSITPDSLSLEYAEGSDGRWKPIETSPGAFGQTTISVQPGTSVEVRGSISDLAGNQGQGAAQAVMSQASPTSLPASPPALAIPDGGRPVGPSPFAQHATPAGPTSNNAASAPVTGFHPPAPQLPAATTPGMTGQNIAGANTMTPYPNTAPQAPPMGPATAFGQDGPLIQPGPGGYAASMGIQPAPGTGTGGATAGNYAGGASAWPGSNAVSAAAPQTAMAPAGPFTQAPLSGYGGNYSQFASATSSASAARQIVNHPVFEIDYQVDDVGPSGVSAVELFVTENNGRNWYRYGNDVDLRSPIEVDTRGEGTFGFAVRARNGLGFSQPAPQPGELPGIVVTVDRTAPRVEFSRPQVVVAGGGRIRLAWRISDTNPSTTPVRLEYSTSQSGPWTPVFDWQMDQGGYEMPIQSGMPPVLHFRLLARDTAGNVTASQTNQPVIVDQRRPTARLLRVQPVSRRSIP